MKRLHPDAVLGLVGALFFTAGTYGLADIPRNDSALSDLGLAPLTYGHGKSIAWLIGTVIRARSRVNAWAMMPPSSAATSSVRSPA